MSRSPASREIFVQEKNKSVAVKRNLSSSVVALLSASQLGFGFNFGFSKIVDKQFKTPVLCVTSAMGCVMILSLPLAFVLDGVGDFWMILYFIQYIPTFFILLSAKYTLCEFLIDLTNTQGLPEHADCGNIGPMAWASTIFMFIIKIVTAVVYDAYMNRTDGRKLLVNFLMHIPIIGLDFIPVANFLLFYVHALVKDFKVSLELRQINWEILLNKYKELADSLDKLRSSYDALSWLLYACSYAWASHTTLEICAPAVAAEMVAAQTDAMQVILLEQSTMATEESQSQGLCRARRCLRARPLLGAAWRLLPLDLRLPVLMLSMCTTYLIVIIQFTHSFD